MDLKQETSKKQRQPQSEQSKPTWRMSHNITMHHVEYGSHLRPWSEGNNEMETDGLSYSCSCSATLVENNNIVMLGLDSHMSTII